MSVLHAQAKKGRVVSKHGRINTFRRWVGVCCGLFCYNLLSKDGKITPFTGERR